MDRPVLGGERVDPRRDGLERLARGFAGRHIVLAASGTQSRLPRAVISLFSRSCLMSRRITAVCRPARKRVFIARGLGILSLNLEPRLAGQAAAPRAHSLNALRAFEAAARHLESFARRRRDRRHGRRRHPADQAA
jgi:hypothetical protein